jgi:hypothetical protein
MRNAQNSAKNLPWVDVFADPNFQGKLHRLYGSKTNGTAIFARPHLPVFRSIIVGPGATARLANSGTSKPIKLPERTVLADTEQLTNGVRIQSLAVIRSHA